MGNPLEIEGLIAPPPRDERAGDLVRMRLVATLLLLLMAAVFAATLCCCSFCTETGSLKGAC